MASKTEEEEESLLAQNDEGRHDSSGTSHDSIFDYYGHDSLPAALVNLLRRVRQGIFGLLFALQQKSSGGSRILFYLQETTELFQWLTFPFRPIPNPGWNETQTEWLITFLNFFVPEAFVYGNTTVFYIVVLVLSLILGHALLVAYFASRNQTKFEWSLKYLRSACNLSVGIFFNPVLSLFTSMLAFCDEDIEKPNFQQCWAGPMAIQSAIVVFIGLAYIVLALTFMLTIFEDTPQENGDDLCRPHSRIEVLALFFKIILSVTHVLLEPEENHSGALVALDLISSYILFFSYVWYLPFFHWSCNILRVGVMAVFAWACTCALIVYILQDPEFNSVTIMFFLGLLFIIPASIVLINYRKRWAETCEINSSTSPFTVELKTRFLLERNKILFEKLNSTEKMKENEKSTKEAVLAEISEIYSYAATVIPHRSILFLFWSNFLSHHAKNKQKSLVIMEQCLRKNPLIDEEFLGRRKQRVLGDASVTGDSDMLDYIICESFLRKATKYEKKALSNQQRFWNELLQTSPNLQNLFLIGSAINGDLAIADSNYVKALQVNPKSAQVLREYSNFLIDVCNDLKRGDEYAARARKAEEQHSRAHGSTASSFEVASMITGGAASNESAWITLDHRGTILTASEGVCRLYSYDRPKQLIGLNVSALIPPPFDKYHSQFIQKYMNTGQGMIINKLRKIVGITLDGYLIPIMILVRQLSFGTRATFIAVFEPVPEGIAKHDYLLLDGSGQIKALSEGCTRYFNIFPNDIKRHPLSISSCIPNYKEFKETMKETGSCNIIVEDEGEEVSLVVTCAELSLAGVSVALLRFYRKGSSYVGDLTEGKCFKEMPLEFVVEESLQKSKKKTPKSIENPLRQDAKLDNKGKGSIQETRVSSTFKAGKHHQLSKFSSNNLALPADKTKKLKGSSMSLNSRNDNRIGSFNKLTEEKSRYLSSSKLGDPDAISKGIRLNFAMRIAITVQRLRKLRKSTFLSFFLVSTVIILMYVVNYKYFQLYKVTASNLIEAGNCTINLFSTLEKLYELQLTQQNSSFKIDDLQTDIAENVKSLDKIYENIYNNAGEIKIDKHLFIATTFQAADEEGQSLSLLSLSLNEAVLAFLSRVTLLTRAANITKADVKSLFILLNNNVVPNMLNVVYAFQRSFENVGQEFKNIVFLVSIVPALLVYVFIMLVVGRTFQLTYLEAKKIYQLFLHIPRSTIRSVFENCTKRLQTINSRTSINSDDNMTNSAQETASALFDIESILHCEVTNVVPLRKRLKNNQHGTLNANGTKGYDFLHLRKMLKLFLIWIFFSSVYFIGFAAPTYSFFLQIADNVGHIVWSLEVELLVHNVQYRLEVFRNNDTVNFMELSKEQQLREIRSVVSTLSDVYESFMSGNTTINMEPYLIEATVGNIFIDDTVEVPILFGNLDMVTSVAESYCEQILYGRGARGLLSGLKQFIVDAHDLIAIFNHSLPELPPSAWYPQSMKVMATECLPRHLNLWRELHYTPFLTLAQVLVVYVQISAMILILFLKGLFYVLVVRPLMTSIEKEIANTPTMLFMLSPKDLMNVEAVRKFTAF